MTAMTINIYTTQPRHEALEGVKSAVHAAAGWVAGHAFYSNKAATLNTVLELNHLGDFLDMLVSNRLVSAGDSTVQMLRLLGKEGNHTEVNVTCAITFQHDEPDLKQPVPAVPG